MTSSTRTARALCCGLLAGLACAGPAAGQLDAPASAEPPDPTKREVPLPTVAEDWRASLVIDNGETGIWTVKAFPVFEQYATPEVVGLDDQGRCIVLVSYSGKWTPNRILEEKLWLGGLAHGDVDPRAGGAELYTGGKRGNLYQVRAYRDSALDARLIAHFPGREIHTVLAGDLDPRTPGSELLVFARPGALYRLTPTGPDGTFETTLLEELPGRVRDAVVLPTEGEAPPEIATVERTGRVGLLRMTAAGPRWSTIHQAAMGKGRLALAPPRAGHPTVLYSTQDDGQVLRHERQGRDTWRTEAIYLGPQGTRGVAAGRFHADPELESVAVFGYSGRVELLTRRASGWEVETLFVDRDKGHWLSAAELDGRNATTELIGSGYGGRIFLLSRPPGYGRDEAADPGPPEGATKRPLIEPLHPAPPLREPTQSSSLQPAAPGVPARAASDRTDASTRADADPQRVVRLGTRAGPEAAERLTPLSYEGGFETKTLVYETLVRRDATGRVVPALAASWRVEDGGRTTVLRLRPGAEFHDGAPVDAEAVALHLRRWVGLPEHAWLGAARHVQSVAALSSAELRVTCDEPYPLLLDLCAVNPCAVQAPSTLDREGAFRWPVGSAAYRFAGAHEGGRRLEYARVDGGGALELVRFDAADEDGPVRALLAGELDALVDGWSELVPRAAARRLAAAPELRLLDGPGSKVVYLSPRLDGGPTARREVRRFLAATLDRAALVAEVEAGFADECASWAAPSVSVWPRSRFEGARPRVAELPAALRDAPLRLVAATSDARARRVLDAVARALAAAGAHPERIDLSPSAYSEALDRGAYELVVDTTWGVPYDPYLSLVNRFLPEGDAPTAANARDRGDDAELVRLVAQVTRTPNDEERGALYARIQARLDDAASVLPLYVPRRLALVRAGAGRPRLDHDLYRLEWSFPAPPVRVSRR